jgi:enolase
VNITGVDAWEVLDSRGSPTVRVSISVKRGRGVFTVPAGASTGTHEATEHRDGDKRYGGNGVTKVVEAIQEDLGPTVIGIDASDQRIVDATLVECDGTESLSNLGANAVLGVSGAVAHAVADARNEPLYRTLTNDDSVLIPRPMVNMLSGGLHARGGIEIQDFLVIPMGAETYPEALETVWSVRDAVRERIESEGERPLVADEGGYAPPLNDIDSAFELLESCVHEAGHKPSRSDIAFAVDVAAAHFYKETNGASGSYVLSSLDRTLDREEMISLVVDWTDHYPVISIEDPLAEDDWTGWRQLAGELDGTQLLGDDLLVTDSTRIERAAESGVANAVLIKPNQAGTVTRTLEAIETARDAGFATVISARSGETCDITIADLAVGVNAGQMKIGSLARSERLSKYNRLLGIDRELAAPLSTDSIP